MQRPASPAARRRRPLLLLLPALLLLVLVAGPGPEASAQTTPQAVPDADVHVVPADWALKPSGLGAGDRF
ncbi:MAG: hypothetical protein OXG47_09280, partial [bacterium]|nr:hypothetical protein [bacterium]